MIRRNGLIGSISRNGMARTSMACCIRVPARYGCTAHNAQILVYPDNSDWDHIAELTGDSSWRPDNMRTYFERLENCHHRPVRRWLSRMGFNPTRHGWKGWLHTEKAIPMAALMNQDLFLTIADCADESLAHSGHIVKRVG